MPSRTNPARTMYPPRYFVGHLILVTRGGTHTRVRFENALMIPISARRAFVFAGTWDCAFYGTRSKLAGKVGQIQYAISALNSKTLRPEIEKFNHPFKVFPHFYRDGDHFVISMPPGSRDPLFITEPLHNVLDHAQGSRVPVIQFIA